MFSLSLSRSLPELGGARRKQFDFPPQTVVEMHNLHQRTICQCRAAVLVQFVKGECMSDMCGNGGIPSSPPGLDTGV